MQSLKPLLFFFVLVLLGCEKKDAAPANKIVFEGAQKVNVLGYTDDLMEPFLSRDGNTLFFNNSNNVAVNTNLHWATKINDTTFEYKGEIGGVNTASLEGVPTMDNHAVLYFVSTRDYNATLASIYAAGFLNGAATNVSLVEGISRNEMGWLNFDVEVDSAGEALYFVDGWFDQFGGPYEADIAIATKSVSGFQRLANSNEILKNVNTEELEYAACISANSLELYFTRVEPPITASSMPQLFVASRQNQNDAFGLPVKITSASGFVEAATISSDGTKLYFHKREDNKFALYLTQRVK